MGYSKLPNFTIYFILNYFGNSVNGFIVIWLIFVALINQIFSGISSIINAPIYSVLTSKIMQKNLEIPNSDHNLLKEIWLAFTFEIKKLVFCLIILILFLAINVIPFLVL